MLKACSLCDENKPATAEFFSRNARSKDGLRTECKVCQKAKNHAWYEKNKAHVYERTLKWQASNLDKVQANNKAQYHKNREADLARNKRWRAGNSERLRQYAADPSGPKAVWRRANKHIKRASNNRRNAAKRGLPRLWSVSDRDEMIRRWDGRCAYCGGPHEHDDHYIPLSSPNCPGTVPWNMVPACRSCNCSKGKNEPASWIGSKFKAPELIIDRITTYLGDVHEQWARSAEGEGAARHCQSDRDDYHGRCVPLPRVLP